ncbi:MAG: hypothetical protein AAFP19_27190, partial [Bacteroidota bacterium]
LMILCNRALLRDQTHQMQALVYSTAIDKWTFINSRFWGIFSIAALLFFLAMMGLLLGAVFSPLGGDKMGPVHIGHYIWPFLVLALPNLFLISALLTVTAQWSQNAIATYAGGILLYSAYWLAAIFLGSPLIAQSGPASAEGMAWAALIDPTGLSAFFEQTQYWEVAEKNTRLVALEGRFLYNRLFCLGLSIIGLGSHFYFFDFRSVAPRVKKQKANSPTIIEQAPNTSLIFSS